MSGLRLLAGGPWGPLTSSFMSEKHGFFAKTTEISYIFCSFLSRIQSIQSHLWWYFLDGPRNGRRKSRTKGGQSWIHWNVHRPRESLKPLLSNPTYAYPCISSHKKTCKPHFSQPTINSSPQQNIEDTIWQVGCYQINPTTPRGQKFFILHMLVKRNRKCFSYDCCFRCFLSSQSRPWWSRTVWTWTPCWVTRTGSPPSDGRWKWKWKPKIISPTHQVRGAMEIALFIQNIQEERAEVCTIFWASPRKIWPENFRDPEKLPEINVQVALYIFTNQSDSNMTEVKYNENRFVINSIMNCNADSVPQ